jgi:hypothetical protein
MMMAALFARRAWLTSEGPPKGVLTEVRNAAAESARKFSPPSSSTSQSSGKDMEKDSSPYQADRFRSITAISEVLHNKRPVTMAPVYEM